MKIHAVLDRSVFKLGESGTVSVTLYDSDGRPFILRYDDEIVINAKRWINSDEYLLEDTSCSITNTTYGECEFSIAVDESTGTGRYLAEITLQRIVDGVVFKSSDFTMWIDRGI